MPPNRCTFDDREEIDAALAGEPFTCNDCEEQQQSTDDLDQSDHTTSSNDFEIEDEDTLPMPVKPKKNGSKKGNGKPAAKSKKTK
jgi:hypothetical protein